MRIALNRTQHITTNWLQNSSLHGESLIFEALLRRGFLVFRDNRGIWLGSGSHPADIVALQMIDGLEVQMVSAQADRLAVIRLIPNSKIVAMDVAVAIVGLGENQQLWTTFGAGPWVSDTWAGYCRMVWGAKLPVCPATVKNQLRVNSALDTGIALFVKALPLARVASAFSCDGHGIKPASVAFHYPWDATWGKGVFSALREATPNSKWQWRDGHLQITPLGGFGDAEVLGLLNDIQLFARSLLNREIITKLDKARRRTIETFGEVVPSMESFTAESQRQLAAEFPHNAK